MLPLCLFVCFTSILSSAAYFCAHKHGDEFRSKVLVTLALAVGPVVVFGGASPATCIMLACVIVCATTDVSSGFVYDAITYPTFCALAAGALRAGTLSTGVGWASITFAVCLGLYAASRRRGLGLGDVKLLTVVAMGTYSAIGEVLAGSFIIGACFVGVMMMRGRLSPGQTIPFAPFIALATIADVPYRLVTAK